MDFNPTDKITQDVLVKIDPRILNMSAKEKVKLIDSIGSSGGSKGLMIDFTFSHTGRRINGRIYSKTGHMRVANELSRPYPKPLSVDHTNSANSVIGRIVDARYVDLMGDASNYFKKRRLSESGLAQMDSALQTLDFERAADAFYRTKVLLNRDWKGIGKIDAKAKISDPEAIIKFIDQRYLNLSAEQDTDAYVCSICMSDWKRSGRCEHSPGEIVDGKLVFMLCGNMSGEGSSVVMNPADEDSIVTSISLSDSESDTDNSSIWIMSKLLDSVVEESVINFEDNKMNLFDKFLGEEILTKDESYSLYVEIFADAAELTQEDYNVLPESVVGKTTLPVFDSEMAEVYSKYFASKNLDSTNLTNQSLALYSKVQSFLGQKEPRTDKEQLVDLLSNKDLTVDTVIKDLIVSMAKDFDLVTKEEFDKLDSEVTTLKDQIAVASNNSSESLRYKEQSRLLGIEYKNLVKDHVNISKQYENLEEKLDNLLDKVIPLLSVLKADTELKDKNIDNIHKLLDSLDVESLESKLNDGLSSNNIKQVTNPALASNNEKISDWDRKVAKKYNELLDSEGKTAAVKYLSKMKVYCSKDFSPTTISE